MVIVICVGCWRDGNRLLTSVRLPGLLSSFFLASSAPMRVLFRRVADLPLSLRRLRLILFLITKLGSWAFLNAGTCALLCRQCAAHVHPWMMVLLSLVCLASVAGDLTSFLAVDAVASFELGAARRSSKSSSYRLMSVYTGSLSLLCCGNIWSWSPIANSTWFIFR